MNGVYGSSIIAFPEQFVDVTYFDMAPEQGSGYGPRTGVQTIRAVVQCTVGRRVLDINGNLVTTRKMELWTDQLLQSGKFVEFTEDAIPVVYRLVGDNEWRREDGFAVYSLERVVGANGTEDKEPVSTTNLGYKLE